MTHCAAVEPCPTRRNQCWCRDQVREEIGAEKGPATDAEVRASVTRSEG